MPLSFRPFSTSFKFLKIIQKSSNSRVFDLILNRPSHLNALSRDFFTKFLRALSSLDHNPDVTVITLSGTGSHFCSGIDLQILTSIPFDSISGDHGRVGEKLRWDINFLQYAITAIERCRKPVIVGVYGACLGSGVDIITACDIRVYSRDAFFVVKEVELAITADHGTLQRLSGIVGFGKCCGIGFDRLEIFRFSFVR